MGPYVRGISSRRAGDYRRGRAPDREIQTAIYSDIRYSTKGKLT